MHNDDFVRRTRAVYTELRGVLACPQMLTFSDDPRAAEQQMQAIIWYLTAIGHLDGDFDESEREYVRDHVGQLVMRRAAAALAHDPEQRKIVEEKWTMHFLGVADSVAAEVGGYFSESVAEGENTQQFVTAKLKLRCFELFQGFDGPGRRQLMTIADAMIEADGVVHPAEAEFRVGLVALLDAPEEVPEIDVEPLSPGDALIKAAEVRLPRQDDHPFLQSFERHWDRNPSAFATQAEEDLKLIRAVHERLDAMRAAGKGRLAGVKDVGEFAGQEAFLDGHVHVLPPDPAMEYELLVIGDLHGCYSCLKAALLQADFFARVEAHHRDPANTPAMKLVLLGDYIDRGRFSYDGILRAAMSIFLVAPDDVYLLRGNHEYYVEVNGRVLAPVRPAEAMTSLQGIATQQVFGAYMKLFEALPNMLLFDRTIFVHAGIPRDDAFREKYTELASLNDSDLRFQMLWSDPSTADVVPPELQNSNARVPFGRKQFRHFMNTLGLRTMVRGHERILEGFKTIYDDSDAMLLSVFSAGGETNDDLPPTSNYREVTPMALTVRHRDGVSEVTPFVIDYARFNDPRVNQFFQV